MNVFHDSIFFISGYRVLDGIDPYSLTKQSPRTLQAELSLPIMDSSDAVDAHGILSNPAKRIAYHLIRDARAMTPARALVPATNGWRRLVRVCALILGAINAEARREFSTAADLWRWALHAVRALPRAKLCTGGVHQRLLSLGLAQNCHEMLVRRLCDAISSELMTIGLLRCDTENTAEPSPNGKLHAKILDRLRRKRNLQTSISVVAEALLVLRGLRRAKLSSTPNPDIVQILLRLEFLPALRIDFLDQLLTDGISNHADPNILQPIRDAAGPHLGLLVHLRAAHSAAAQTARDHKTQIEHALCCVALEPPEPLRSELDLMIEQQLGEHSSDAYFMLRYNTVRCDLHPQLNAEYRAALRHELARRISHVTRDHRIGEGAATLLHAIESTVALGKRGSDLVSSVRTQTPWVGAAFDPMWSTIAGPLAAVTSRSDLEQFVLGLPAPPDGLLAHEHLISGFDPQPIACRDSKALRKFDRNAYISSSIDWPSKLALVLGAALLSRFAYVTIDEGLNTWWADSIYDDVRELSPQQDPIEVIDETVEYFEQRNGRAGDQRGDEMAQTFDAAIHAGLQRCVTEDRPDSCFEVFEHSEEWIDGSQWLSVAIETTHDVTLLRVLELAELEQDAKARRLLRRYSRTMERFSSHANEERSNHE